MNVIPRSSFGRIALSFAAMVIVYAVGQFYVFRIAWEVGRLEAEQRLHWNMATQIRDWIYADVGDINANLEEVHKKVYLVNSFNPKNDVGIFDKDGTPIILPTYAEHLKGTIDIPAVERFLKTDPTKTLPIYAKNRIKGHKEIFSAARIPYRGETAYVYVTIGSFLYRINETGTEEYYLLTWGGVSILLAVALAAGLAISIYRVVTSRFKELQKSVAAFADGDRNARADTRGRDELATLSAQFNEMADSIVEKTEQLEQTDRERRDMVANISHDLRSPITALFGSIERIQHKSTDLSEEERAQLLQSVYRNASALSSLVEDLFELAKFDSLDTAPNQEAFSLIDIALEEVIARLQPLAKEHGITLADKAPETVPLVMGDPALISRVVYNLVENGIRYCERGDTVAIRFTQLTTSVVVEISDNGPGISEDDLPRIFERFYRADKVRSRNSKGTGLGLAIVKKIVEAHGSTIRVTSTPGKGTTFSFELQIAER